jgi:hypothetical protein
MFMMNSLESANSLRTTTNLLAANRGEIAYVLTNTTLLAIEQIMLCRGVKQAVQFYFVLHTIALVVGIQIILTPG